jgi:hypothetical protein
MGKTQSKPLEERHGRGMAGERHGMCESALTVLSEGRGLTAASREMCVAADS